MNYYSTWKLVSDFAVCRSVESLLEIPDLQYISVESTGICALYESEHPQTYNSFSPKSQILNGPIDRPFNLNQRNDLRRV